ncbi:MAG: hypothetical protein IPJ65_30320 [Archangiaceae bacterium]|nr:hypothetical protein [Archangiaceae bacterium]
MGILVLIVGLAVLGFGFIQHLKGKRILAAPFKKTGDLARDPTSSDPKGAISTEGKVNAPQKQLLSPCSKTPCLYYEVKIERLYEKQEKTQDGYKTVKGSTTLDTLKGGAVATVDDGSGAIPVDFSKGGEFDNFKPGFKKELNGRGWASSIQFGELSYDIPVISSSDGYTIGFRATEKLVPVEGNLFVLGKIEGGTIIKPGWRSMMVSSKGRDGLLASTAKKKKFSLIGGGVGAAAAIPLMIFGPKSAPSADTSCHHLIANVQKTCSDNVTSKYGNDYSWTVEKAGRFTVSVTPPAGKKYPLDAQITIKDAAGEVVADVSAASVGGKAVASVDAKPGTYKVTVKDLGGDSVKGGYDYTLEVASLGGAAVAGDAVAKGGAAPAANESAADSAPVQIEAPKLAAQLMAKQAAGYDGKLLEVKGLVAEVSTEVDATLAVFVTPDAPNGEPSVVAAALPAKAKVKKGQFITVRGLASADEQGIMLTGAELVQGSGKSVAAAPKGKTPAKGKKVQPRNAKK